MAATLYYFYHRGKGELSRLALVAAGIEYKQVVPQSRSEFLKWIEEGKLLFHQIPVLEIDGKQIAQSRAIVRYVGKKASLLGKNDDEEVKVDMVFEGGFEFTSIGFRLGFTSDPAVEAELENTVKTVVLPKFLPIFEKIAAESGTGFMVGDSLTIADLSVLEGLLVYAEHFGQEIFNGFPAVKKFYDTVTSLERISTYLKGPNRPKKNDHNYISKAKAILGRKN